MKSSLTLPWMEKYRPKKIDEIFSQEKARKIFKEMLNTKNMPHLLLYGPPGTGKTSAAIAFTKELYKEERKKYTIELNASDDRGIKVVREKIKVFASLASPNIEKIPFRIIILDEADAMTTDAQTALRRIMEIYSITTRFFLICNRVEKIISPIQSRCVPIGFRPLNFHESMPRLKFILKNENIFISDLMLEELFNLFGGELRKTINCIQILSYTTDNNQVNNQNYDLIFKYPSNLIESLWNAIFTNSIHEINNQVNILISSGVSIILVFRKFLENIKKSSWLPQKKAFAFLVLNKGVQKIFDETTPYIQLLSVSLNLANLSN